VKSKKRYVIGFWIAISLVVALAIGLVAVLAAFTAAANSSFSVEYTAKNVNATINASIHNGDSDATTLAKYIEDIEAVDETDNAIYTQFGTATFKDVNQEHEDAEEGAFPNQEISFDSKGDYTFIKLEIKNNKGDATNAGGPIDCEIKYTHTKNVNIVIEYKTSDTSEWAALSNDTTITKDDLASEDSFVCYVRIRLDNRNQNASIEGGNFEINLSVA